MEEEGVVWPGVLDEPVHRPQNVLFRRLAQRILLVVREYHHVVPLVAEIFCKVCRHVPHVVDASSELAALTKVVDANEKSFPPAAAVRVPVPIAGRCAIGKLLERHRRGRRGVVVPVNERVRVCRGHCYRNVRYGIMYRKHSALPGRGG